jgi:very-short-patch-repair endonuclease
MLPEVYRKQIASQKGILAPGVIQAHAEAGKDGDRKAPNSTASPLRTKTGISQVVDNKAGTQGAQSSLETKFERTWIAAKGQPLIREAQLIPSRRWRVDFLHPESRVVIECEGMGGRHQTFTGFTADAEKYLAITLAGYTIFRLTSKQVTVPILESIADFITRRLAP